MNWIYDPDEVAAFGHVLVDTGELESARDVLYYVDERQSQFEGVVVQQVWLRGEIVERILAQLFGTVGPITPQILQRQILPLVEKLRR